MTVPIRLPRRVVLVHFRTPQGVVDSVERQVFFARGFGHYIRHRRRLYIVGDPNATSLVLDGLPHAPDPDPESDLD